MTVKSRVTSPSESVAITSTFFAPETPIIRLSNGVITGLSPSTLEMAATALIRPPVTVFPERLATGSTVLRIA